MVGLECHAASVTRNAKMNKLLIAGAACAALMASTVAHAATFPGVGNDTSGPVTVLLLLSTPSMGKLLFRARCPPTEGPEPTPTPPEDATPAVRSDRFKTPEPTLAVGKSVGH